MNRFIIEQSDKEFYTSNSGLSLIGLCVNKHAELSKKVSKCDNGNEKITTAKIVKSYFGLLVVGKSDYEAVENVRKDEYFKAALGIKDVPSAASLRQRLHGYAPIAAYHDSIDTLVALREAKKVSFIVKWNPRRSDVKQWKEKAFKEGRVVEPRAGKREAYLTVRIRRVHNGKTHFFTLVIRVTERTVSPDGQMMFLPDLELEGWWTSLELPEEHIIRLHEDHAVCEQYHSEFKSDLDIERLPSGKFATNALILSLSALAYNILRIIGQLGLMGWRSPVRHKAKRRRIKTVIQELLYLAARVIRTGNRLKLRFGKHCPAFQAFEALYYRLLPT